MTLRLALAGLLCGPVVPSRAATPDLRYQFKAGSNYVYSVRLEATEPDYTETVTGTATYAVKSATTDAITFTTRSSLHTQRKSKQGSILPGAIGGPPMFRPGGFRLGEFGLPGGRFARPNEVQMDSKGQVLQETGRSALPQALGDLSHVVTESLPTAGKSSWEVTGDCVIILEEKEFTSPVSRLYRIKEIRLPAKEKTSFTLGKGDGSTVPIIRKYELKTAQTVAGQPRMSLTGEGTNSFDLRRGLIRAVEFKGTLTDNTENTTVRVPLTLTCKLLEGEELVAAQKAAELPPKPELKAVNADERTSLIADLKGDNKTKRSIALGRLATVQPDDNSKAEVTGLLLELLKDSDQFTRQNAAKALGVWGTSDAAEPLVKALDDAQFAVRWAAIDALGRLKDSRGIEPLAQMVAKRKEQFQAGTALKSIGDAAEPAVLKLLEDKSAEVRRDACQILKVIGTKKSAAALEAASRDSDGLVALLAKQALEEASKR